MFCPNCGTKNESSAEKCAQCGFDLQAKKPAAKFKGTVMMQSPVAQQTGGEQEKKQPGSPQAAPKGAAPQAAPRPEQPAAQKGQGAQGGASSKLKGTMIGVAPPSMQEEIDKARQAAQAKKDATSAKPEADAPASPVGANPPAGGASSGSGPSAGGPSAGAASVGRGSAKTSGGGASSKLKGTMIGVAPPEMRGAIDAARAKVTADRAQSQASSQGTGQASAPEPEQEKEPASDPVNPLGGTVVGTSPFHQPGGDPTATVPQGTGAEASAGAPGAAGTPPQAPDPATGTSGGTVEMPASAEQRPHPSAAQDGSAPEAKPPANVAPGGTMVMEPPQGQAPDAQPRANTAKGGTMVMEPPQGQAPQAPQAPQVPDPSVNSIPGKKKSPLPLVLLFVALLLAAGLLVVALMGGADGADDTAEDLTEDVTEPGEAPVTE